MSVMDEPMECPLCMEPLEMDDLNFYPCTCGYQICRFCWHRIRTDENGLCPACRKAYPENPADFKPLSQEELQRIKQEKRQKDLQRKQKVSENRKHLANVRVVQKNLVFVVGLSSRLAEQETLRKSEYFGKFGKIHKVVINHSTTYAGSQGPSASAYVTYQRAEDALRAIQAVNNIHVDGRTLKASLGTTKYCSNFMKNQSCPKADCMYLHELGDEAASFTKEEMQQGKHQEFEKKLQDQYLGTGNSMEKQLTSICTNGVSGNTSTTCSLTNGTNSPPTTNKKIRDTAQIKGSLEGLSSESPSEFWPALNTVNSKENPKRSRSKSERNTGSARHTPIEDTNNRNRSQREREKKTKEKNVMEKDANEEENGLSVSQSNSSSQDSCTSSASTTPPPSHSQESLSVPETPPLPASSPLPVITTNAQRFDRESTESPIGTTPSSLSSCSEPSSSLPNSLPTSHPHTLLPLPPSSMTSSSNTSLFMDNSNSFFSEPSLHLSDNHPSCNSASPEPQKEPASSTTFPSTLPNGDSHNNSDWRRNVSNIFSADSCSSTWNDLFEYGNNSDINNLSVINHKVDDELGFDPFEETNKALAEDIKIEQKQLEQQQLQQQRQLQIRQQIQQQQQKQQLHHQLQQQQQQSHLLQQHHLDQQLQNQIGLKNLLEGFSAKDITHTRPPPPGFNGFNSLNSFSSVPQNHLNKMSFINMAPPQALGSAGSPPPQLNGLVGSNRIGVPPGLAANNLPGGILNGHTSSNMLSGHLNNLGNGLGTHLPPPLLSYDTPLPVNQAPPGITVNKSSESYQLKDLETSLRNMFPSVSTMNTVNTLNTLAAAAPQATITSQTNTLTNFLNMAQQNQHQQQFQSQPNLIHQLGPNMLQQATQKGWNSCAPTDLSALDPAILSSGHLTDSRSDSPPHWLKSVEQLTNDGNLGGPHSWNNLSPYSVLPGALPNLSGSGMHGGSLGVATQAHGSQRASSIWQATSPPPGFNTISPLLTKCEGHKIENI